jgi:hypothetical protein
MSHSSEKPDKPRRRVDALGQTGAAGDGIRRWRRPAEWAGRDSRPGFYSVTGDFIDLADQPPTSAPDLPH